MDHKQQKPLPEPPVLSSHALNTPPAATKEYSGRFVYCGLSAVVAPDGSELARAQGIIPVPTTGASAASGSSSSPARSELLIGVCHSDVRIGFERRNPYRHDRRPELFAPISAAKPVGSLVVDAKQAEFTSKFPKGVLFRLRCVLGRIGFSYVFAMQ